MSFKEFNAYSFMVVANLDKLKIYEGSLQLKLKFSAVQNEKQVLLWTPMYSRKIVFDRNLDVTVE